MSLTRFLALLSFYSAALGVSAQLNVNCISNSGAVLSSPSSGTWNEDRLVYNQKVNVQPAGVAYAHSEAQVQSLVHCATASGLKAVARGGGHGYEGEHSPPCPVACYVQTYLSVARAPSHHLKRRRLGLCSDALRGTWNRRDSVKPLVCRLRCSDGCSSHRHQQPDVLSSGYFRAVRNLRNWPEARSTVPEYVLARQLSLPSGNLPLGGNSRPHSR